MGENGAGKSTLIKIICGVYRRDEGSILYNGKEVDFRDNLQARINGVGIVPQEIQLAPKLTVAENIFMGMYPRGRTGLVSWRELRRRAREIAAVFSMERFLDVRAETLGTGHRQLIEILKALIFDTRIIAFDEPTAALSDEESRELFTLIETLKARGISIIYVSHRLDEIFQIADRVTVFKDGRFVGTREIRDVTKAEVISMMVGRELALYEERTRLAPRATDVLLEVKNLCNGRSVQDISFALHKGEILGFFGMVGSGRTETAMTIFGVTPPESGEVLVRGKAVRIRTPLEAVGLRLGLVPENRIAQGIILNASIRNNITLPFVERLSRLGFIQGAEEVKVVDDYMRNLAIKAPSGRAKVKTLSGGNQQKVSIAKWLASRSDIIIFDEPTHGVDVGAKAEIYHIMRELAAQGKGIILISSELPEILNVCDRVIVFRNGRIAKRFEENRDLTEEAVITYAIGKVEARCRMKGTDKDNGSKSDSTSGSVGGFFNQARMFLVLVFLVALFAILSPYFFRLTNIYAIGLTISVIGIVCIGQSLILITGAFDLSVGGIAGLSGMVVAILTKQHGNYWGWFFVGLAVGTGVGLVNGLLITKLKINALITTLSMMTILLGVVWLTSGGFAIGVNESTFRFLGTTRVTGVPLPIVILVVLYAVFYVILKFSVFGRYVYSIGGNSEAARLSGINVDRIRILVYTVSGLLSGFGGIVLASRLGSAQVDAGSQYPINSIAACVLGGISIAGGEGVIWGSLIGVAIVGVLQSGLIMVGMPSYYQWIATGIVLLAAVYLDQLRKS